MNILKELSLRKVINASGTMTHLGNSTPDLRVIDAMREISQNYVIMMELIQKSGKMIADITGAEAGLVTSGSSAGLVLAGAACILKDSELENFEIEPIERVTYDQEWRSIIQKLPDSSGMHNQFIMQKTHRNAYDHAFKIAGGKIVEVGTNNGCNIQELEKAINEKTAGIIYAFHESLDDFGIPLKDVVEVGHKHDIPIIVDAAMEVPPKSNLKRFIAEGVDLVVYSGGKHIRGPSDSGFLCGKKKLIKLATLQSSPYRGIGRGMKIDRTQIIGLLTALRILLSVDEEAEYDRCMSIANIINDQIKKSTRVLKSEIIGNRPRKRILVKVTIEENNLPADEVVFRLRKQNPSIWLNYVGSNKVSIDPYLLKDGEEKIVISAFIDILETKL